jgi:hypothetical protein
VKYCYCTSKLNEKLLRYSDCDCFYIRKEDVYPYFKENSKATYIYISPRHIYDILFITLSEKLNANEFEEKPLIDETIFADLFDMIQNSTNLSPRFKKELLKFLQNE